MYLRRLITRAGHALAYFGLASYATPPEVLRAFDCRRVAADHGHRRRNAADAAAFETVARIVATAAAPSGNPPDGHPERVTGRPLSAAERPLWAQLGFLDSSADQTPGT